MTVTPDGRTLVEVEPRVAHVFDLHAGTESRKVEFEVGYISLAKVSADARRLVMLIGSIYQTRKLVVVALEDGQTLLSKGAAQNAAISSDGQTCVLARAADIQLFAIDRPTEKPVVLAKLNVDSYSNCALSPSGNTLAVQTNQGPVVVFDLVARREKARLPLKERATHECDDRHVVVATKKGLLLFDIEQQTSRTLPIGNVTRLAIAPDGLHFAARIEGALIIVDLTGKESLRIPCKD